MNPQPPSDEDALGRDRPRPVGQSPDNVWHILEGALWACVLLLLLLLLAPLRTKVLLANPVWAKLGDLSYSIYLLHLPLFTYALRSAERVGRGRRWMERALRGGSCAHGRRVHRARPGHLHDDRAPVP